MTNRPAARRRRVEIIAPAGNFASLKAAVENGADVVYLGFNDATNARNFEGLNFTPEELEEGVALIRKKGRQFYVAINTFPQRESFKGWEGSVDRAVALGADAIILADLGVLNYARTKYPDINIHLSVQASASNYESINFYRKVFNIKRVVLPRVLTIPEIRDIAANTEVELEVFMLGGLCINIEGRCYLSSFLTGASTNTEGACSPSRFVRFTNSNDGSLSITLNDTLLNRLSKDESSAYPTCCKGRYVLPDGSLSYAFEEPESLNALSALPELIEAGVSAVKLEGRQRTKTYVAEVTRTVRKAVQAYYKDPGAYKAAIKAGTAGNVLSTFEGTAETLGCYLEK